MKSLKPIIGAVLCTAVILSAGCITVDRAQQICERTERIASTGTRLVLLKNPEYRPAFEAAVVALREIPDHHNASVDDVVAIMASLPVKELQSPEGFLIIEGVGLGLDLLFGGRAIDLTEYEGATTLSLCLADALSEGLGTPPL